MPSENATTSVWGLQFSRDGRDLIATRNETRVVVAREERYPGAN